MDSNKQQLTTYSCSQEFLSSPKRVKLFHNGFNFVQVEYHFESAYQSPKILEFKVPNKLDHQLDLLELQDNEFISSVKVLIGKIKNMQIRFSVKNRMTQESREFVANSSFIQEEGDSVETLMYPNIMELPICIFQVTHESVVTQFTCEFVNADTLNKQTQIIVYEEEKVEQNETLDQEVGQQQDLINPNQILESLSCELYKHLINYQSLKQLRLLLPRKLNESNNMLEDDLQETRQQIDKIMVCLNQLRQLGVVGFTTLLNMDDSFRDILLRMQELLGSKSGFNLSKLKSFSSEREKLIEYQNELKTIIQSLKKLTNELSGLSTQTPKTQIQNDKIMSEEDFKKAEESILHYQKVEENLNKQKIEIQRTQSKNLIEIRGIDYKLPLIKEDQLNAQKNLIQIREQLSKASKELQNNQPQERPSDPQSQSKYHEEILNISEEEKKEQDACINQYRQRTQTLKEQIHSLEDQIQKQELDCVIFSKIHNIIVIDESSSMKDAWPTIQQIYLKIGQDMNAIGSQHLITTIMFSDFAEIVHKKVPASSIGSLRELRNGGTNFLSAFERIIEAIEFTPFQYIPIVQFLTDGQDVKADKEKLNNAIQIMKVKAPAFKFFATGIGPDYNKNFLQDTCLLANGSSFLKVRDSKIFFFNDAKDASALDQIFSKLAVMYETDFEEKKKKQIKAVINEYDFELIIKQQKIRDFYESQRAEAKVRDDKGKAYLNCDSEESEAKKLKWLNDSLNSLEEKEYKALLQLEELNAKNDGLLGRKDDLLLQNDQLKEQLDKKVSEILQESATLTKIQKDWNEKKLQNYEVTGCATAEQTRNLNSKFQSISDEIQVLRNIATNLFVLYEGPLKQLSGIIQSQSEVQLENLDTYIDKAKLHRELLQYYKSKYQQQLRNSKDVSSTIRILLKIKNEKKYQQLELYYNELYVDIDEKLAFISLATSDERAQFIEDLVSKIVPIEESTPDQEDFNDDKIDSNEIAEEQKLDEILNKSVTNSFALDASQILSSQKSANSSRLNQSEEVEFLKYSNKEIDFESLKTIEQVKTRLLKLQQDMKVEKQNERQSRTAAEKKQFGLKLKKLTRIYDFCREILNNQLVKGRIETLISLVKDIVGGPMVAQFREQKFKGLELQFLSICKITQPRLPLIKELNMKLSIENIEMYTTSNRNKKEQYQEFGQLFIKNE